MATAAIIIAENAASVPWNTPVNAPVILLPNITPIKNSSNPVMTKLVKYFMSLSFMVLTSRDEYHRTDSIRSIAPCLILSLMRL